MPTVTSENRAEFMRNEMEKKNTKPSHHPDIGKEIEREGHSYKTTSRAWWMDGAIENKKSGAPTVARIEGVSKTHKHPSERELSEDEKLSPYHSSETYSGKPVRRWIDLSEDDLTKHKLSPGKLNFPEIVDSPRPKRNDAKMAVSEEQYQKHMHSFQNEDN